VTIRIGMVDLDTSHCELFAPLVNAIPDLAVTAVWDGGSVHPPGRAERFAAEFGIPRACRSLDEVVEAVDVGMLMGQDWDLHLDRARAFLEAGKPVFIDKPIVGRIADVTGLIELSARTAVPVMGGSSLRYAPFTDLRARVDAGGGAISAFASGPHDVFNYGTHAAGFLGGFFGAGVTAVRHIGDSATQLFLLERVDGIPIVLQLGTPDGWFYSFTLAVTTASAGVELLKVVCDDPTSEAMNDRLIADFVTFARGGRAPLPLRELLEECTLPIAAAEARRTGERIALDAIPAGAGFDGAAFAEDYARAGGWRGGAGGAPHQPTSGYSVRP
jgi:hypothetical protein